MQRTVSRLDFITNRKSVENCNIIHDMKLSNRIVEVYGFLKTVSIKRSKHYN